MAESRIELLAWLNELLQTRYTKVEQAGTGKVVIKCTSSIDKLFFKGAAYCQIFDSIFGMKKTSCLSVFSYPIDPFFFFIR